MIELSFVVEAKPVSQGSMKNFIIEGKLDPRRPCDAHGKPVWERKPRVVTTSDNDQLAYYRDLIGYESKRAVIRRGYSVPFAGKHEPVEMVVEFVFERPKSVDERREMVVYPDIDKLQRALLDGLTGVLFHDDAQVVAVTCRKRYGRRAEVRVRAAVIREATLFDVYLADVTKNPKPPGVCDPRASVPGEESQGQSSLRPTADDRKQRVPRRRVLTHTAAG